MITVFVDFVVGVVVFVFVFNQIIFGPGQTMSFFKTRWMKVGPRGVVCFFTGIMMVMYSGFHPVSSLLFTVGKNPYSSLPNRCSE